MYGILTTGSHKYLAVISGVFDPHGNKECGT